MKNVPKAEPAPKPVYQKEPVVSPKSVPIEFNSTGGPVYKEAPKDAVFYRTDSLLYQKFENMVIFRPGNLYSLCSPGNQHYKKKGRNWRSKFDNQKSISTFFDEKIKNQ